MQSSLYPIGSLALVQSAGSPWHTGQRFRRFQASIQVSRRNPVTRGGKEIWWPALTINADRVVAVTHITPRPSTVTLRGDQKPAIQLHYTPLHFNQVSEGHVWMYLPTHLSLRGSWLPWPNWTIFFPKRQNIWHWREDLTTSDPVSIHAREISTSSCWHMLWRALSTASIEFACTVGDHPGQPQCHNICWMPEHTSTSIEKKGHIKECVWSCD